MISIYIIKYLRLTDKETTVYTDRNILETVLRNLVNNAIKYTYPDGLVRIRSAINEEKVKIEVIDNGTGISEENLNKLFKLEQTFTTKGTSEEEGSGLGLILCKEFIEINGGEIWVESVPEQGSKFTFTIPRKRTNEVH